MSDKLVATVVAIAGVVTGFVGVVAPIVVALIQRRNEEGDDDMPPPALGLPIPVDHHRESEYELLRDRLNEARLEVVALRARNELLTQQQIAAYGGWQDASTRLAKANDALRAAGLPTY